MEGNSLVLCSVDEGVATLTLNNPEKRNALSTSMLETLKSTLSEVAANRQIKVVILAANGPAFSSGHDLKEMVAADKDGYIAIFALCSEVMEAIRNLPQPVIAQVHAMATAAGSQLVATCDLVVASPDASFATPGVKIGLFCTTPAVALSRVISAKKAMEMLLTGTPVRAEEAERIGLVNRVVPAEHLKEETMRLARQIATASSQTVCIGKRAFNQQLPLDYPEAYEMAQKVMVENALIDDAQEGMRAFLEKRTPVWKDAAVTSRGTK